MLFTFDAGGESQPNVIDAPVAETAENPVGVHTPGVVALPGTGSTVSKPAFSARTHTVNSLPVVNPLIRTVVSF